MIIKEPIAFQWDKGNAEKNLRKHGITDREAEEAFFDKQRVIYKDVFHSDKERRYIILGRSKQQRLVYVVFAKRNKLIRVISVRRINRKEVRMYEKTA